MISSCGIRNFATQTYHSEYLRLEVVSTAVSVSAIHLKVPRGVAVACLSSSLSLGHGQMLAFAQHTASDGHGAYALSIQQSAERLVLSK